MQKIIPASSLSPIMSLPTIGSHKISPGSSIPSLVPIRMPQMLFEVCEVFLHQRIVTTDDEQVLGILFFCGLREVERSGNDSRLVDDHDLVVRDGVLFVNVGGDTGITQEGG